MSIGNLAKAIASVRDRCKPAEKDATNQYHRYRYASAEEIMTVCHEAMQKSGLAIIRQCMSVNSSDSGHHLAAKWVVVHESGESIEVVINNWPVIPDKGRPLDKAVAAALTTSLSYLLRDLFQIPRVDEADDISGRNDTAYVPQQQPQPRPQSSNGHVVDESEDIADVNAFKAELKSIKDMSLAEAIESANSPGVRDQVRSGRNMATKLAKLNALKDAMLEAGAWFDEKARKFTMPQEKSVPAEAAF